MFIDESTRKMVANFFTERKDFLLLNEETEKEALRTAAEEARSFAVSRRENQEISKELVSMRVTL